jgi:hypothetical protein
MKGGRRKGTGKWRCGVIKDREGSPPMILAGSSRSHVTVVITVSSGKRSGNLGEERNDMAVAVADSPSCPRGRCNKMSAISTGGKHNP